ncbi:MAG TPA: sigma-70 family RNA polymerase sigma factor [Thermoanaerobaculia bacterium]|nr:sigma-70 family RNA polymerase sigma factor [Thermoanaerobaculia bacterium]
MSPPGLPVPPHPRDPSAGEPSAAFEPAELARRIHQGDPGAEEELVRRFSGGVLYHLRKMTGDRALSEDLHQDTFRIVLERLRRQELEDPSRLAGFILGTARNVALGDLRKRTRRGDAPLPETGFEVPDPTPGQLGRVLREEEDGVIERLLDSLGTERDRQLLLRFYVAEEDREQICADYGLTFPQFNRVIHRARQRFKELLVAAGLGRPNAIGRSLESGTK